jgi:glyoxylase I family protein
MFKRIDHVEIVPSNVERALAFYNGILGFKVKERVRVSVPPMQEVIYLTLNDTMLELISVSNPSAHSLEQWQVGYKMMALEVSDMAKALDYLKGKGITPTWGPVNLGKSIRAEIKDSDGLSIELRQWNI